MSLPGSRFVVRYVHHGHRDIHVNGKRIDVGKARYVVVDLHEEFPLRAFKYDQWEAMWKYRNDMNYAHDPYFRLAVDLWKIRSM